MPRTARWTPPARPFTRADVDPLGVTPTMLATALAAGRIARLHHGVFIAAEHLAEDPVARHLQQARAVQLRQPRAIASHATAALAWDLDLADPTAAALGRPTFIVPADSGLRSAATPGSRVHVRELPVRHRTTLATDLHVTSLARTAVDVAAELPLLDALVPLDAFARAELTATVGARGRRSAYTQPRRLAAAREPLLEAAQSAGTQFTRAWLQEVLPMTDPRRESPLESISYVHMQLAGLPTPELQAAIMTHIGEFWVDFLWRAEGVIGEADGDVKYRNDPDALVKEKRRQEALEQLGFIVIRWSYQEMVRTPAVVIARIHRALARRS